MDPITAVGFAASILNFIDYSHKVVTGTIEVFRSGSTAKNVHISEVISDLQDAAKDLTKLPPGRSDHEKALHQLSASCQELAKELTNLLARLSTTDRHSKWTSVRVALRSMRKDGKVAELESTLDKYRSQVLLRLTQIVSDQQLQLQVELCDFRTQARDHGTATLDELRSLRTELLEAIENSLRESREQEQATPVKQQGHDNAILGPYHISPSLDNQLARIDELRETLDQILEKKDTPTPEMRILQQLWVDDMYVREDNIHEAEGNTFGWILDGGQGEEERDRDEDAESNRERDSGDSQSDKRDNDTESNRGDDYDEAQPDNIRVQNLDIGSNQADDTDNGHEDSSSLASQARPYPVSKAYNIRNHTRSTFQEWLKHGKNVFHISGKAGSGKSTLMKLIINDQRTYKCLEEWAGDKELITAQFFFWRAGSDIQRSRQGLYRSLLFETLKQCPLLIQDVFPEAHKAFKKKTRENSIDKLFFRTEHIETAFQMLVSLTSSLGCRMCLFIDGLDEYGAENVDSYEYEKLAKSLTTWTNNQDVKILASSRPYREFHDAFPESLRIHLHEVNAHDIQSFSRHMFETDDQFLLVEDLYEDLVRRIVNLSAGVFLWARLVVRSLIASIHRGDPVDSLVDQLEVTPKDLSKLYEHFFSSIGKIDQERAFKMLLLFAYWKVGNYERFNALFFSWLDQLQDHNFPMSYEMKPYTDREIQDRLETVKRQIAGLTHGLLEMTSFPVRYPCAFFSRSIQFFHRTARDFVLENLLLQKFHADHPYVANHDTYLRLDIAGLWFSKPGAIRSEIYNFFMSSSSNNSQERPAPGRLEAVAKARKYHNSDSSSLTFLGQAVTFSRSYVFLIGGILSQPESTFHKIVSEFEASDYIEAMARQSNQILKEGDRLSCLLSAFILNHNSPIGVINVRHLLRLGVSPMQLLLVYNAYEGNEHSPSPDETKTYVSVWSIFLACLIGGCNTNNKMTPHVAEAETWEILELLLEHGGWGNSFFLLSESQNRPSATHIISLRELIRQCRPQNEEILLRLVDKDATSSFRSRMKEKFCKIRSRNFEKAFHPVHYKPFHINMWSPEDFGGEFTNYFIYSVWSEDCETKIPGLTVRIY